MGKLNSIRKRQLTKFVLALASVASGFWGAVPASAAPARFGLAPDNSFELYTSTLKTARNRILINIYQFESKEIADALIERIQDGITVQLLVEGKPFGGRITPEGRDVLLRIRDAMAASGRETNRLWVMSNWHSGAERRYVFNHAKYTVIDSNAAIVSSENLSSGGHPLPGQIGNRGWEVALQDPTMAGELEQIFKQDTSTQYGDVVLVGPKDPIPVPKAPLGNTQDRFLLPWQGTPFTFSEALGFVDDLLPADFDSNDLVTTADSADIGSNERAVPALPIGEGSVEDASLITSPNSAEGLVKLIQSAKKTIDVEKMNLPSRWRDSESDDGYATSPLVDALVSAARRGVKVRALLNDDSAFDPTPDENDKKKPNDVTVDLLRDLAKKENLPIQARIVNIKAVGIKYIHNKGILVDGKRALVSSINGTQNSVLKNREVGIVLESADAAKYFKSAFDFDWKKSSRH